MVIPSRNPDESRKLWNHVERQQMNRNKLRACSSVRISKGPIILFVKFPAVMKRILSEVQFEKLL